MLLTQKYVPKKLTEVIGNEEALARIRQWILNWMHKQRKKPLLIHGPTGVGKTTIAYVLQNEFDLELIEMNASELRDKKSIGRVLTATLLGSSLSGKRRLLLQFHVNRFGMRVEDRHADGGGHHFDRIIAQDLAGLAHHLHLLESVAFRFDLPVVA